jgi:type I restriction enzyme S subunit
MILLYVNKMSKWEMVKLGDVCRPKQWKTISTGQLTETGYPVYGANGVIGFFARYTHEQETLLVTCRGATCGSLNICKPFSYVNGNAMALDNLDTNVNIKFLYYFLLFRGFIDVISGSAQPQIIRSTIEKIEIPLPPLDEQKKIADELDKISHLIAKRKSQLEKLDLLVKAKFIEMFGDPVENPMGWKQGIIRDVVHEVKYGTSRPSVDEGKYSYLRMNNITYGGQLDLSNLKQIDIPNDEYEKCVARNGDVLFNRTNSKELVGKTCVYNIDEPMVIAGYIIRVRTNEKVIPIYLSSVLNSKYGKNTLFEMCKAIVGQANINAQELQNIKVLIPPITLQNQFADYVEKVERMKANMKNGLINLETLYKSRMQEYFG